MYTSVAILNPAHFLRFPRPFRPPTPATTSPLKPLFKGSEAFQAPTQMSSDPPWLLEGEPCRQVPSLHQLAPCTGAGEIAEILRWW